MAGRFRGGRAPADSLFSAGGLSSGLFRRIFFCILRPKNPPRKSTAKSTTCMAVFWQIFHRRLNPRPAASKFQVQHWNPPEIGTRFVCPFFPMSKECLEHGNCSSGNFKTGRFLASQTDRTRNRALKGQKAGRNIDIKDKDGTTKFIASLE